MFLTELKINDFRNHPSLDLVFSPNLNCIVGNNAIGKTNILEAIYYLSTLASFRVAKDEDLVRWGKEAFSLLVKVNDDNRSTVLKVVISNTSKFLSVNGAKKDKSSDFIGYVKTVFFSPEDLSLVKGSPQIRRKFLDHFLSQLFPSYHYQISKYKKLLRQKNAYLKELKLKKKSDLDLLDVFDDQAAQVAAWITLKRLSVLKKLLPVAKKYQMEINPNEDLNINYHSFVPLDASTLTHEKLIETYVKAYKEMRSEEIIRCMTLVGPQRDDIVLTINKKNLKEFGSQGQQRTATIALKLAQAEIFNTELGENPIILLDDIFSELDEHRRNNILGILNKNMQVFITATDVALIPESYRENSKIFDLCEI